MLIFERVEILLNPDLDAAAATQPKIGLNEVSERIFPLAAAPITKPTNFVALVCTSEKRTRCFHPLNAIRNPDNETKVGFVCKLLVRERKERISRPLAAGSVAVSRGIGLLHCPMDV